MGTWVDQNWKLPMQSCLITCLILAFSAGYLSVSGSEGDCGRLRALVSVTHSLVYRYSLGFLITYMAGLRPDYISKFPSSL